MRASLLGSWFMAEVLAYLGPLWVLVAVILHFAASGDPLKHRRRQA